MTSAIVSDALLKALAPAYRAAHITPMTGGICADVFDLQLTHADHTCERLVVRHHPTDGQAEGITIPQEYALLSALHDAGLPVPRPRLLWPPDTLVMQHIEGTTQLPHDAPAQLASALARIHAQRGAALHGLPDREDPTPLIHRALDDAGLPAPDAAAPPAERCLLHGDLWPGNVLWHHGAIAAILDWEDAAIGDPLSDLACSRVELEVTAGQAASDAFTTRYLTLTRRDPAQLHRWDLYVCTAALDAMDHWGLPPDALAHRRAVTSAARDRALSHLHEK